MKVTALIPDQLMRQVVREVGARTITESLVVALQEWLSLQKIKRLNELLEKKPLKFRNNFSAEKIRKLNRQ